MTVTTTSKGISGRTSFRSAALIGNHRVRPIVILLLAGLVLFTGFRLGLSLARWGMIRDMGLRKISLCFLLGLRYDMMILGYVLLPLVVVLSLVPRKLFDRQWFLKLVNVYGTIVIMLEILGETVGAGYFLYRGGRLDWQIHYLSNPAITLTTISKHYPIWLLVPFLAATVYATYRLVKRHFWRGGLTTEPAWRRCIRVVVMIALCVLACRGGLGRRPLRKGAAYITTNNLVTQLSMNDFFTVFKAVRAEVVEAWTGRMERSDYPFPELGLALETTRGLLYRAGDAPVEGTRNPLRRRSDTGRPSADHNVVLIVMEGMSCEPVGALGFSPSYTPHLDGLCRQGLFFESMYAVGTRTNNGLVGVLCSHPDRLDRIPLMRKAHASGKFDTLPAQLRRRGYETFFFYGGEGTFDNMTAFFKGPGGINHFIERSSFNDADLPAEMLAFGQDLPDEMVFDRIADELDALGDRKFFATVLTMSNHPPYMIPSGRVEQVPGKELPAKRLSAYRYADWALGRFFERARASKWFDRTIFVLVADHGHWLNQLTPVDVPSFRVPCVFYAPGIIKPQRIRTVCSQVDIAPTLLALLGGAYEHSFMGRNVPAVEEGDGFAAMQCKGVPAFVRGGTALVLPPLPHNEQFPLAVLFRIGKYRMDPVAPARTDPAMVDRLQLEMLSYYAVAKHVYMTQTRRDATTSP